MKASFTLKNGLLVCLCITVGTFVYYMPSLMTHYSGTVVRSDEVSTQLTKIKMACVWPKLRLYYPEILKLMKTESPVRCSSEEDWVYVDNGTLRLSKVAERKHGRIKCDYTPIIRGNNDFSADYGQTVKYVTDGYRIPSDFFRVDCRARDGKRYSNVHLAIARVNGIHDEDIGRTIPPDLGLNILIIGLDSVSRLQWMRMMPKSHNYLTESMGAVILEGVNVVGEGTPAALFPILTGKHEEELPPATKNVPGHVSLDGGPFIWKDMKRSGYVTLFNEDASHIGCFTYRLRGFNNKPTDHYPRPFYLVSERDYKPPCLGAKPNFRIAMDYINDTYRMYPDRLKFIFTFLTPYTHSSSALRYKHSDEELAAFLRRFVHDGHMNKTLLFVLSDHGSRFSDFRSTVQGKVESLMPYVSITLPQWFSKSYPRAISNLKTNVKRLVTVFDIHETLRDVLSFRGTKSGNRSERGISLFREIPPERTCEDADIRPHWCSCLSWSKVAKNSSIIPTLTKKIIYQMKEILSPVKKLCSELKLKRVYKVSKYVHGENMLKFRDTITDEFGNTVPDLSDKMKNAYELYQLTVQTDPGDGMFEVTVKRNISSNVFSTSGDRMDRINIYGTDADCLKTQKHLRKLCYCKR